MRMIWARKKRLEKQNTSVTSKLALLALEPEHHLLPAKIAGHRLRSQPVREPVMDGMHHALVGPRRSRCVHVRVVVAQR